MGVCDVCGSYSDRAFTVRTAEGRCYLFDTFECAVHRCAPQCARCACRVLGHAVESNGLVYCSQHCGRTSSAAKAPVASGHVIEVVAVPQQTAATVATLDR